MNEHDGQVRTISIKSFEQEKEDRSTENTDLFLESKKREVDTEIELKLQQAAKESAEIIEAAQLEAEVVRTQLNQEEEEVRRRLSDIQEEARQLGFEKGFEQGLEAGKSEYDGIIHEAREVVELSKQDYLKNVEKSEPVILELALAVAEKLIGNLLLSDEEYWKQVIKSAISEVKEQKEVRLYVHPDWYEKTLKHKDELENLLSQVKEFYIFPDAELAVTGCIVETPYGRIDASLDSQLAEVKKQLHEKLKENSHEGS